MSLFFFAALILLSLFFFAALKFPVDILHQFRVSAKIVRMKNFQQIPVPLAQSQGIAGAAKQHMGNIISLPKQFHVFSLLLISAALFQPASFLLKALPVFVQLAKSILQDRQLLFKKQILDRKSTRLNSSHIH